MLLFRIIESAQEYADAKALFLEYAASLNFDLCFQNFEHELANIDTEYSPPEGGIILCYCNEKPAGCVALRKLEEGICEMKRMYVRSEFRGKGIGNILSARVINFAKKAGYRAMRLDTMTTMAEAIKLYEKLGFVRIAPYRYNPIEGAVFMELKL